MNSEHARTPDVSAATNAVDDAVTDKLALELADIAASLAERVGSTVKELRELGVRVANTKSSLADVVTEADQTAEAMIVSSLAKSRPNDAIFGEEGTDRAGSSGITWVIDPIDGTVNYLYDLPAYCVSIAACISDSTTFADGRTAIAGAIANPKTGELFVAARGHGSTRNGEPIHVQTETALSGALVGTGFGYTPERRAEQAAVVAHLLPQIRDIRRIGSAAYDLCLLASGRLDAFYEHGLQPWDYAAGALIAREAGATILGRNETTLPGEPFFIAAHRVLAHELQLAAQPAIA